jgi:hypothetical protein
LPLFAHAQEPNQAITTIQSDIAAARNVQKSFAEGLPYCAQLDGNSYYNGIQKRVVQLGELKTSMDNLIKDQVFNPQKKRPWNAGDAEERMQLGRLQAERDRDNCKLVAKLPELTKELRALESRR